MGNTWLWFLSFFQSWTFPMTYNCILGKVHYYKIRIASVFKALYTTDSWGTLAQTFCLFVWALLTTGTRKGSYIYILPPVPLQNMVRSEQNTTPTTRTNPCREQWTDYMCDPWGLALYLLVPSNTMFNLFSERYTCLSYRNHATTSYTFPGMHPRVRYHKTPNKQS